MPGPSTGQVLSWGCLGLRTHLIQPTLKARPQARSGIPLVGLYPDSGLTNSLPPSEEQFGALLAHSVLRKEKVRASLSLGGGVGSERNLELWTD